MKAKKWDKDYKMQSAAFTTALTEKDLILMEEEEEEKKKKRY